MKHQNNSLNELRKALLPRPLLARTFLLLAHSDSNFNLDTFSALQIGDEKPRHTLNVGKFLRCLGSSMKYGTHGFQNTDCQDEAHLENLVLAPFQKNLAHAPLLETWAAKKDLILKAADATIATIPESNSLAQTILDDRCCKKLQSEIFERRDLSEIIAIIEDGLDPARLNDLSGTFYAAADRYGTRVREIKKHKPTRKDGARLAANISAAASSGGTPVPRGR